MSLFYKYFWFVNRKTFWFRMQKGLHLDLGCGNGYVLKRMREANPKIKSIAADIVDFSSSMPTELNFIKLEAGQLPFEDNYFDCVTLSHVIEHVKEPNLLINEIKRVLRQKGQLYIECPSERSLWVPHIDDNFTWNFYDDKTHIAPFRLVELSGLLENEGFKIIKKGYYRNYLFLMLSPVFIALSVFSKFRILLLHAIVSILGWSIFVEAEKK